MTRVSAPARTAMTPNLSMSLAQLQINGKDERVPRPTSLVDLPPDALRVMFGVQKAAVERALASGSKEAIIAAVRELWVFQRTTCAMRVSKGWSVAFEEHCSGEAWKVACEIAGFVPVDPDVVPVNIGDWRPFFKRCYNYLMKISPRSLWHPVGLGYTGRRKLVPGLLKFVSDIKTLMLVHVLDDPLVLQLASKRLRNDKDVVIAAVKQDGMTLWYASHDLKNDKEVVIAALSGSEDPIKVREFVSDSLINDVDVVCAMFWRYPETIVALRARFQKRI